MLPDLTLRPLRAADVPAVLALQARCYESQFLEGAEAFGSKLTAAEAFETCWMAWRGITPLAYLVSLPACLESLPALDAPRWVPPARPRLLYLHDMAVAPEARMLGLAGRLLAQVEQRAGVLGLAELALVAVQGSEPYWQRRGFATLGELPTRLAAKLASFGDQARFMRRKLA